MLRIFSYAKLSNFNASIFPSRIFIHSRLPIVMIILAHRIMLLFLANIFEYFYKHNLSLVNIFNARKVHSLILRRYYCLHLHSNEMRRSF